MEAKAQQALNYK
jgi:hypothetical protein